MSLLSTATTWTIEDNHVSKKRIPQIRKTVKHFKSSTESSCLGHSPPSSSSSSSHISSIFHSGPENFSPGTNAVTYNAPRLEDAAQQLDERNKRVHELLNHITAVNGINAGSSLADFNPPTYPEHSQAKKIGDATREEFMSPAILSPSEIPDHLNELQHPIPQIHHSGEEDNVGTTAHKVYAYREDKPLSNYRNVYAETPLYHKQQGLEGFLNNNTNANDKDLQRMHEKINYMIRILEDLKVEKTENITEEFIMFSMLGVFVIFIVDSFSKSAKYVR